MRLWFLFSRICALRYHPPVIFTLHLKFIFHMKFVGPVDVRSHNTPSGAVILSRPFLSEFRLIKKCACAYIMTLCNDVIECTLIKKCACAYIMTLCNDVIECTLLSPASDSLSSLDSKLRHSAYAHLRVARAQCVYGFYFLGFAATLSPSSDLHITPQIYISYEICGARRCSIP